MHHLKKAAVICKNLKLLAVVICVAKLCGSGFLLALNCNAVALPMILASGWGKLWIRINLGGCGLDGFAEGVLEVLGDQI